MSQLEDIFKDLIEEVQKESVRALTRTLKVTDSFDSGEINSICEGYNDDIKSIGYTLFLMAGDTAVLEFLNGCQMLFAMGYRAAQQDKVADDILEEALGGNL